MAGALSQYLKNGTQLSARSGAAAINPGDLVIYGGPYDEAVPAATIDYAKTQAASAIKAITATANVGLTGTGSSTRQQAATDQAGNLYLITASSGGQGLGVVKLKVDGTASASADLDTTANPMYSPVLVPLANHTWSVVYYDSLTYAVKFVIFDALLDIVAGPTTVGTANNDGTALHAACARAVSGFGVAFQDNFERVQFATFTNLGAVDQALTPVWTLGTTASGTFASGSWAGGNLNLITTAPHGLTIGQTYSVVVSGMTPSGYNGTFTLSVTTATAVNYTVGNLGTPSVFGGYQRTSVDQAEMHLAELASGNFAVTEYSPAYVPAGTNFEVITPAGAVVAGPTNVCGVGVASLTGGARAVNLSTVPGTFAVTTVGATQTTAKVGVYSDAGALQGSVQNINGPQNTLAGGGQVGAQDKLENNGINYFYAAGFNNKVYTSMITPAGVRTNWPPVTPGGGFGSGTPIDMALISGQVVAADAAGACVAIALPEPRLGITQPYSAGTAAFGPTATSTRPKVIGSGDFTAIFACVADGGSHSTYGISKIEASSILGVSQTQVPAGNPGTKITVNVGPGSMPCNALRGTPGQTFDHSSSTPHGNKGSLYSDGVNFVGV